MQEMRHKRIVLVETDPRMAQAITRAVRCTGCRCDTVTSAEALRDAVTGSPPDLVVIDGTPDGPDPRELCQSMRREARTARVRIMVLIASGRSIERRRCLAFGADGVLAKPFGLPELRAELRRLLEDTPVEPLVAV